MSVFGPNGCGKSTLINMIAGLFPPDAGRDPVRRSMPLNKIKFGYVFQNYIARRRCFPGCARLRQRVAYPLKVMGVSRRPQSGASAASRRSSRNLNVKIDLNLYPYQMSGRPAASWCVDHAGAGGRSGNPVSRRAVLGALDYEMTLFMREQAAGAGVRGNRHHHWCWSRTTWKKGRPLPRRTAILLLSRHPARASPIQFMHYEAPRPRTDKTMTEADFISTKAHRLEIFQREVRSAFERRWTEALQMSCCRIIGVVVLFGHLVARSTWMRVVDPVLLPSPIATFKAMWAGMFHGKLGIDFVKTWWSAPSIPPSSPPSSRSRYKRRSCSARRKNSIARSNS